MSEIEKVKKNIDRSKMTNELQFIDDHDEVEISKGKKYLLGFKCVINTVNKKAITSGFTKIKNNVWQGIRYNNSGQFGVICNEINDIEVLDLDIIKVGDSPEKVCGVQWFKDNYGDPENQNTFVVKTSSGGYHLYYKYGKAPFKNKAIIMKNIKIDFRGKGKGYVCFDNNCEVVCDKPVSEFPDDLLNIITLIDKPKTVNQIVPQTVHQKEKLEIPKKRDKNTIYGDTEIEHPIRFGNEISENDIKNMIRNIDLSLSDGYNEWLNVGFCCKNLGKGSDLYKEEYRTFSKLSDKYDEDAFEQKWKSLNYRADGLNLNFLMSISDNKNNELNFFETYKDKFFDNDNKIFVFEDHIKFKGNKLNFFDFCIFIKNTVRYCHNNGESFLYTKNRFSYNVVNEERLKLCIKKTGMLNYMKEYIMHNSINFKPIKENIIELDCINTFQGFAIEKHKRSSNKSNLNIYLKHIKEVICNNDEVKYEWLIQWKARIIQEPWKKTNVAPIIFGEEGAGKNVTFEFFGKYVLGNEYYKSIEKMAEVTDRFNDHMKNKLFFLFDEVKTFSGKHSENDFFKNFITRTSFNIEAKQKPVINNYADYSNSVFLSNNLHTHMTTNKDRRYAIFETSSKYLKNHKYFNNFIKIQDLDLAYDIYYFLKTYDISNFDIRDIPQSIEKDENVRLSAPNHIQYLNNIFEYQSATLKEESQIIDNKQFYDGYIQFCKSEIGGYNTDNHQTFMAKMGKLKFNTKKRTGTETNRKTVLEYQLILDILNDWRFDTKIEEEPKEKGTEKINEILKPKNLKFFKN